MANLIEAAKSGNKREALIALRDKLAETIERCESGRDMAANTKRFMEVITELDHIDSVEEEKRLKAEAEARKKISKHDRLKRKNENR